MNYLLSTTNVDAHGMKMTKEVLENSAEQINGKNVIGMGFEHDVSLPPIGKFIRAWVKELEDGEYGLFGELLLYDKDASKIITLSNGEQVIMDTWQDERPFADKYKSIPDEVAISYDLVNFETNDDIDNFQMGIEKEGLLQNDLIIRKSFIPDPELLITLSKQAASLLVAYKAYRIFKPLEDKVKRDLNDDLISLQSKIRNVTKQYAQICIPKNRPVTYILVIPGAPTIEFVIKTINPDDVMKAIKEELLNTALKSADEYHQSFNAQKIQFLYSENTEWKFNYLLTSSGKVVGSKDAIKNRSKAIDIMRQQIENQ